MTNELHHVLDYCDPLIGYANGKCEGNLSINFLHWLLASSLLFCSFVSTFLELFSQLDTVTLVFWWAVSIHVLFHKLDILLGNSYVFLFFILISGKSTSGVKILHPEHVMC